MTITTRTDPSGIAIRHDANLTARYLAQGHWRAATMVDSARAAVSADPGHLFQIEGERRMTRGEVWDGALRLAGFFLGRGLRPGDVISFQLPNWVEAAVIALAARMCGLIINPVPPIYREAELRHILADCRSRRVPQARSRRDGRGTAGRAARSGGRGGGARGRCADLRGRHGRAAGG